MNTTDLVKMKCLKCGEVITHAYDVWNKLFQHFIECLDTYEVKIKRDTGDPDIESFKIQTMVRTEGRLVECLYCGMQVSNINLHRLIVQLEDHNCPSMQKLQSNRDAEWEQREEEERELIEAMDEYFMH